MFSTQRSLKLQTISPIHGPDEILVSDLELIRFATLIYQKTGLRVSPQKRTLLSNRLRRRLRVTGIESFTRYYDHLLGLPESDPEWDAFWQVVTTHETSLFRDPQQWDWITQFFLPRWQDMNKAKPTSRLSVWAAACSSGDELYSIACCLARALPKNQLKKSRLLGTDLAVDSIDEAKKGKFSRRAMRNVTPMNFSFFEFDVESESWVVSPILKKRCCFEQHNLVKPLLTKYRFDLVFLKNVLIYFDRDSKETVLDHVDRVLKPGGFLITGVAEGVGGLLDGYTRIKPWLYKKEK
jgi:chemotaxis protein methyltransferase CheR